MNATTAVCLRGGPPSRAPRSGPEHQADRTEMGALYERAVEHVVRQFRGQRVPGGLFGADGELALPVVDQVSRRVLNDPTGLYGPGPDRYEIEVVTAGPTDDDRWAITRAMIERFLAATRAIEKADGKPFGRRWIVAPRGIPGDALLLVRAEVVLHSGKRDIERLARRVAGIEE